MDVTPHPVTTDPFAPPSGQPLGSQAWGQHPRHVTPPGVPKSSLLQGEGLSTPQGDPALPSQRRGCHYGVPLPMVDVPSSVAPGRRRLAGAQHRLAHPTRALYGHRVMDFYFYFYFLKPLLVNFWKRSHKHRGHPPWSRRGPCPLPVPSLTAHSRLGTSAGTPQHPVLGQHCPFFVFFLYLFTQPFVSWFLKSFFYLKPPGFVPGNDVNKRAPFWGRNLGFDVSLFFFFPLISSMGLRQDLGGTQRRGPKGGTIPCHPERCPVPCPLQLAPSLEVALGGW